MTLSVASAAALQALGNELGDDGDDVVHDQVEAMIQDGSDGISVWVPRVVSMDPGNVDASSVDSFLSESEWAPSSVGPYVQLCFFRNEVSTIIVNPSQELPIKKESPGLEIFSDCSRSSYSFSVGDRSVSSLSRCSIIEESDASTFWLDAAWYHGDSDSCDETHIGLLHDVSSYGIHDEKSHGCARLLRLFARLSLTLPVYAVMDGICRARTGRWSRMGGKVGAYVSLDMTK